MSDREWLLTRLAEDRLVLRVQLPEVVVLGSKPHDRDQEGSPRWRKPGRVVRTTHRPAHNFADMFSVGLGQDPPTGPRAVASGSSRIVSRAAIDEILEVGDLASKRLRKFNGDLVIAPGGGRLLGVFLLFRAEGIEKVEVRA